MRATRNSGFHPYAPVKGTVHMIERGNAPTTSDMSKMVPFSLPRLPVVAVGMIFQLMSPLEIVDFSLISRRARFLVKLYRRRNSLGYMLTTKFDTQCCVAFETNTDEPYHFIYLRRPDQKLKTPTSQYTVIILNDPVVGLRNLTEYIYDLFDIGYKSVQLNMQYPERKRAVAMERWTYNMKESLQHVCLLGKETDQASKREERDLVKFLNNYGDCEMMCVHVKATEAIEDIITMKYLHSHHSQWVTLNTLFNFKSRVLVLMQSRLTNKDINSFLDVWKTGNQENRRLKDLVVELRSDQEVNVTEAVSGLGGEWIEVPVVTPAHGAIGPDHDAHLVPFHDTSKFALVFRKEYFEKICLVVRFVDEELE